MVHLLLRGTPLVPDEPGSAGSPAAPAAVEAVLFDKDGTLSHSEPMLEALAEARVFHCLSEVAARLPGEVRSAELTELLRRAYGMEGQGVHPAGTMAVAARGHNLIATATVLVQVGLGWPESLSIAEEVFARTDSLHGGGSSNPPQPTDGLRPLLEQLQTSGVRCAVISNDHEPGIHSFLEAHGLSRHFQAIWSAGHRPCKPDPGAVHGVCRELGVPAGRCALIGDANSDLRMARAAGVAVVLGYRAGWRQPPPLDPGFPQLSHWQELTVSAAPAGVGRGVGQGTVPPGDRGISSPQLSGHQE